VAIDRTTSPRKQLIVALELDGHEITSALVDENARILSKRIKEQPGTSVVRVARTIADAAVEHSSDQLRGNALIKAIGICVPGHVDPPSLRVSAPEVFSRNRVALKPALERALEGLGIDIRIPPSSHTARADRSTTSQPRIAVSSSRACEVIGEVWAGVAKGRRDVVFLSIGRSIEAGLMINGAIVRGSGGFSGMLSAFASEASANGLLRHAIEALPGAPTSVLTGIMVEDPSSLTAQAIVQAARGGDSLALALVGDLCRTLGRVIANLVSLLSPEMVIIGGDFGLELRPFMTEIRRAVLDWAYPESGRRCRVALSMLGGRGRLLGAARLAIE
jgi:predicted NBD/HSP70 family sugar kinase